MAKKLTADLQTVAAWRKQIQGSRRRLQRWLRDYDPRTMMKTSGGKLDAKAIDPLLWGEKDSYLSALARLIQLDLKLLQEEMALRSAEGKKADNAKPLSGQELSRGEWEMLAEACTRELSRNWAVADRDGADG